MLEPIRIIAFNILSFINNTTLYQKSIDFLATKHHSLFIVTTVLPVSFIWDTVVSIYTWYVNNLLEIRMLHEEKVDIVQTGGS